MRLREVVRTDRHCHHVNRPTTAETLQADVLAILSRSRVNKAAAADAGKVEELVQRLRGGGPVKMGRATYMVVRGNA